MPDQLSQELGTYEANINALLGAHEGKFILIYQDRILGAFDNQMDAIARGYDELGNVPFLVKLVTKVDIPLSFVSNLLKDLGWHGSRERPQEGRLPDTATRPRKGHDRHWGNQ